MSHPPQTLQTIEKAAQILKEGGLVAFPTETVYGLGADASQESAIRRVFETKGRPADHPVIVHIHHVTQLSDYAKEVPKAAFQLAEVFWPGPLTLILPKKSNVSPLITGGQETVGLRVPNHPTTLALLKQLGRGLIGPSANPYGRISPTTASHVKALLKDKVDSVLDGGPCQVGIESTIVYFVGETPHIARYGAITQSMINEVLGISITQNQAPKQKPQTPGNKSSHYAPKNPVKLLTENDLQKEVAQLEKAQKPYALISFGAHLGDHCLQHIQASLDPKQYAETLYAYLHELDKLEIHVILIEKPPETEAWLGIQDRLSRASFSLRLKT